MRLSSIKLAGFKSFVEPTKIPFPDPMTCVVGPNGCGKSNVIDAVRWVLGESSAKNLRGDAMTDVIFNGSTERKPVSQASVELNFDNTQGHLPGTLAARNQVAIKRVVNRDGQSTYYLNGDKCRKRDITDIFLGTGLGPRSYAIIEQGMISRLIESKPQDLRVFLEEAAGVSKYKERRRETESRIRSTRDNLARLLDVRQELGQQLATLETQASDAKHYTELKAQEREVTAWLAALKWQQLNQEAEQHAAKIAELKDQLAFLDKANLGHDDVLASFKAKVSEAQAHHQEAQMAEQALAHQITRDEQSLLHLKQQKNALAAQKATLETQLADKSNALEELSKALKSLPDNEDDMALALLNAELDELDDALLDYQQHIEQARAEQESKTQEKSALLRRVQDEEKARHQLELRQTKLSGELKQTQPEAIAEEITQLNTEQAALLNSQKSLKAELAKIKAQIEKSDTEKHRLAGELETHTETQLAKKAQLASIKGQIAAITRQLEKHSSDDFRAQLVVKKGYEAAIASSLGWFNQVKIGAQSANENRVWAHTQATKPGFTAVSQVIEDGVYPSILDAIALCDKAHHQDCEAIACVTQQGDIFGANFALCAPQNSADDPLILNAQLEELSAQKVDLEHALSALEDELNSLKSALATCQATLDEHKHALHQAAITDASTVTELKRIAARLEERENAFNDATSVHTQVQTALTELTQQLLQSDEHLSDLQHQLESASASEAQSADKTQLLIANMQSTQAQYKNVHQQQRQLEKAATEKAQQHAVLKTQISNTQEHLNNLQNQLAVTAQELEALDSPIAVHQAGLDEALHLRSEKREHTALWAQKLEDANLALGQKEVQLKSQDAERIKLTEALHQAQLKCETANVKASAALEPLTNLKRALKDVLAELPLDASISRYQKRLNDLARQCDELGAVNLAAVSQFEQAQERKHYLDAQYDDLTGALDTLEAAISKIDKQTKHQFKTTFDQVNRDFGALFPKVFGGGQAYLALTEDDLLHSGVTIMARPPGKKNATIHLLSGGEKALTALSLVFSIFRLNPAPFCMLDEVDAPLDDANVGRFCRLVEEMSASVQFIYISHNKIAMEMAGRLTGVTMAEPGVSRMVAVDIDQAVEMASA